MLDPAFVRDNPDAVRERLAARGKRMDAELDALAALESERRALIPKVEELKRQQNASGEEVARAKKAGTLLRRAFSDREIGFRPRARSAGRPNPRRTG